MATSAENLRSITDRALLKGIYKEYDRCLYTEFNSPDGSIKKKR